MKDLRLGKFGYLALMHVIVLTWGFTGIMGKLIHLDFYQIVFFRTLIAGGSLLAFLLLTKKKVRIKDRATAWKVVGVGIIVVLHWLTFFKSIQVSTASVGVLCLATTTLHVSWLEPLVMKRRFSKMEFAFGLLVIFGVLFVTDHIDPSQYEGIFWGLVSALFAGFFAVFNARLNRDGTPSSSITVYEMLAGTLALFVWLLFRSKIDVSFFVMTWEDFGLLLFLGIVCTALAFMLMIDVVNRIGAYSASLTINLEPVYSIGLAIIILHENELLGPRFYFGALFIVAVVFMNPVWKHWTNRRKRNLRPTGLGV